MSKIGELFYVKIVAIIGEECRKSGEDMFTLIYLTRTK